MVWRILMILMEKNECIGVKTDKSVIQIILSKPHD